jgi:chitin-binding protein
MTVLRTLAVAAVGAVPLLLTGVVATPASAHGALTNPLSRAAACGTEGGRNADSPACQAALATDGMRAVEQWDNLRVSNSDGRDREVVPDGRLCSGGIEDYRGLDLPRLDWPATTLAAGADFTFTYRGTIPHRGTFRVFVTRDGYQPTQPLRWSDLEDEPFLTATDPAFRNGTYVFPGTLPTGKVGRHLIYTIWQNSDTPDTYYSCSDVVFRGTDAGGNGSSQSGSGDAAPTPPVIQSPPGLEPAGATSAIQRQSFAIPLLGGVGAVLIGLALVALVRRRAR